MRKVIYARSNEKLKKDDKDDIMQHEYKSR